MDATVGTPAGATGLSALPDPCVLIIEPDPTLMRIVPWELRTTMPDVAFDVSSSVQDGLSALSHGRYHTLISDARLVETDHYSILKQASNLSCAVPVLISAKAEDVAAADQALKEGALDIIPCPPRGRRASLAVRPALWLYRLRLTMYLRRQRLQMLLERRSGPVSSRPATALLEQAIRDIQQTNEIFNRTIHQIESSLHVLEDSSVRIESQMRQCAIRMVRLLQSKPSNR